MNYTDSNKRLRLGIGLLAFLTLAYHLLVPGRRASKARGKNVFTFYTIIALYSTMLWLIVLIVWVLAAATTKLERPEASLLVQAFYDILSKSVIGSWVLYSYATVPELGQDLETSWWCENGSTGALRLNSDEEG